MSDRELLELAAKAAGYDHLTQWSEKIKYWDSPHHGMPALHPNKSAGECYSWNPLENSSDAFMLLIDCRIEIFITDQGVNTVSDQVLLAFEPVNYDLPKATRRAIVRAAAAMGEQL